MEFPPYSTYKKFIQVKEQLCPLLLFMQQCAMMKCLQNIWRLLCHVMPMCVDEWKNFQERVGWEEELKESEELMEELRLWASYRGQTLARTGTPD